MIVSSKPSATWATGLAGPAVGTGPFKFQEWRSADRIIFARNPDYRWGRPTRTPGLRLSIGSSRGSCRIRAQVEAFERGELSVLGVPQPTSAGCKPRQIPHLSPSCARASVCSWSST